MEFHDIDQVEIVDLEDELAPETSGFRLSFAGTVVSVVLHVWLLVNLSGIDFQETLPPEPAFIETRITNEKVEEEEPEEIVEYELANPDEKELDVREVINAASVGVSQTKQPELKSRPKPLDAIIPTELRRPLYDIPEGMEVDERIVVKGTTGDNIMQIESALDLVTWEVAQNLKEKKVLLVWMLDGSASIIEQRKKIASRLRRIYGELDALKQIGQIPQMEQPLLSAVVTFGEKTNFITRDPTDDFETIHDGISNAPTDPSGKENVFTAVTQSMKLWSERYRVKNGRQIMLVVVTDEAGDDFGTQLEPAIAYCRRYGAKSYVIGPLAPFGRRYGFVPYTAPENNQVYQLPVDLGPETAVIESLNLPFWYRGPQLRYLSSGFPPYALARLVHETGGRYFTTNSLSTDSLTPYGVFDFAKLKPFQPDYSYASANQYRQDMTKHPIRRAVVEAAMLSREFEAKGTPLMDIRVTPQNFKQVASNAQVQVAESELMISSVLNAFPAGIEEKLDMEPLPRWRMAFALSYGRLLANKVRCIEYNSACASLKNDLTPQDVGSKSNHWILKPSEKINYAGSLKRSAKKAQALLERVVEEAPGTPWAVMAMRELQNGMGIAIEQRFIPPPPPPKPRPANAARPPMKILFAQQPKKKGPLPKPPPKPKPPVLPKL
ncbi:MAG: hypothetical protein CMJ78_20520 [Planctomycetaceae bacterium]|nr:hypothetical protein [Planctomycetaceae bacterium]